MSHRYSKAHKFPFSTKLLTFVSCLLLWGGNAVRAEVQEIDLLVIYTPAVFDNYGSSAGVIAHAAASVESVNTAMENSEIPVLFHLVGVELVDYVESASSMEHDLYYITGDDEGFFDEDLVAQVHGLRNAYGADIVSLFRDGPVAGTAGIAWMPNPNSPNHRSGYNVVAEQSAISSQVLAHELGHNLSSGHGHGESGADPVWDYARGHIFSASGTDYRTIMSNNQSHTRIPYFSNPNVFFEGEPTGVSIGLANQADNYSAFSEIAPFIADFRLTQTETPVFLVHPVGATIVSGQAAELNAFVQGFPPLNIQWYAGLVGDTSTPLASTDQEREQGGTDTFIQTPVLSEPTYYWLELTNPNSTTESDTIQVVVIPPLPEPQTELVVQSFENTFVPSPTVPLWQNVIPGASFIGKLQVRISREGEPGPATLRFEELGGDIISETSIDPLSLAEWNGFISSSSTVDLPVNQFVIPGITYRITLIPTSGDGSNRFIWIAGSGTQDSEVGIGDSNIALEGAAFSFTILGEEAWTYHTWLGSEDIPFPKGRATDDALGDGLPNLLRYALGFGADDPRSLVEPVHGGITNIDGTDVLPFLFSVRRDAVDVELIVETSNNLTDWAAISASQIHFVETVDNIRDVYEARLPIDSENRQFIRVRLNNPPQ